MNSAIKEYQAACIELTQSCRSLHSWTLFSLEIDDNFKKIGEQYKQGIIDLLNEELPEWDKLQENEEFESRFAELEEEKQSLIKTEADEWMRDAEKGLKLHVHALYPSEHLHYLNSWNSPEELAFDEIIANELKRRSEHHIWVTGEYLLAEENAKSEIEKPNEVVKILFDHAGDTIEDIQLIAGQLSVALNHCNEAMMILDNRIPDSETIVLNVSEMTAQNWRHFAETIAGVGIIDFMDALMELSIDLFDGAPNKQNSTGKQTGHRTPDRTPKESTKKNRELESWHLEALRRYKQQKREKSFTTKAQIAEDIIAERKLNMTAETFMKPLQGKWG
ncbi:hypothetical protein [uncultured Rubinisphaera sp.]|uniref:hypothetical protein n=1 Tax=uncultured Rubinisphaera sp. TaxID=1678686 RepID=UPI0030DC4E4B